MLLFHKPSSVTIGDTFFLGNKEGNYLISKIDFYSNYFRLIGNNLYCINNGLNTESIEFTDNDRQFLCSCAKKKNRIVANPDQGIYNYNDISQQYIVAS